MTVPALLLLPMLTTANIVVDGAADEPAWEKAIELTEFVSHDPVPQSTPSFSTRARILADDQAIYIHFDATDPEPHKMRATLGRRDNREHDSRVGLFIDPYGNGQRAWFFEVTAAGVQHDGIRTGGDRSFPSRSWDGRWQSEAVRHDDGYSVEIAIPWKTIRHPVPLEKLGITLIRAVSRKGELSYWPGLDPDVEGILVQQAVLKGPGNLRPSPAVEWLPELTFGLSDDGPDTSRPGVAGISPGLTLRALPNPSMTALATVNPDFSQIESDRAKLDINERYALSYEEKRPFFLEGHEAFDHPFDNVTYTRSLITPSYGLRATREQGPVSIAVLHALDSSPAGSVSEGVGWTDEELDGRSAIDTLARFRHGIGRDGHVGLLLSDKEIAQTGLANRLVSVDSRLRASDRLVIETAVVGAQTTQSSGDDLSGTAGVLDVSYGSKRFAFETTADWISPDFRAENGFVTQIDRLGVKTVGTIKAFPTKGPIASLNMRPANFEAVWQTDGALRELNITPNVFARGRRGSVLEVKLEHNSEDYEGTWLEYDRVSFFGGRRFAPWLMLFAGGGLGEDAYYDTEDPRVGSSMSASGFTALRPTSWSSFSVEGEWERFVDDDGSLLHNAWYGRYRLELFASRALWWRFIIDQQSDWADDTPSAFGAESLIAWERTPGQAFYLGAAVAYEDPVQWQVFTKLSWVFAP